jgi:hypothetical protein
MKRAANDLLLSLQVCLPEGCRERAMNFRPDVVRFLAEASDDLVKAASVADPGLFAEAVRHCSGMYLKVSVIYKIDSREHHAFGTVTD